MKTLPDNATDEQIRQLVIDWIELLADERYTEALEWLYMGQLDPYRDGFHPDGERWTPDILRLAIASYGVMAPEFDRGYRVVPATPLRAEVFAQYFQLDRSIEFEWVPTPEDYLGIIHCYLPLTCPDPVNDFADDEISDLSLIVFVRRVDDRLALELSQIHQL